MLKDLKTIRNQVEKEIKKAQTLRELTGVLKKYLGKQGKLTLVLNSLKKLPEEKRKKRGKEANSLKIFLEKTIEEKRKTLQKEVEKKVTRKEKADVTMPGKKVKFGHLHPLTQTKREIENIFQSLGFSIIEGPEIENEWYNFDALNIPQDHPARDMWDTLWLKTKPKLLLRTHTSPVQIRYMAKNQPPLRVIVPGRVYRHEATDAGHEINFYQVEGLIVDKKGKINVANFKAIIEEFIKRFFAKSIQIRLRPSFFPFTEPSFEVDMSCVVCSQKGCSACKGTGWVELMGAGMVHPNVFKNVGLNPQNWQGFAFGLGMDRFAMMKYKINDIRLFYDSDLRFLNQF